MRCISRWIASLAISFAALGPTLGNDFPPGSIKIIVPFGPGGTGDLSARIIGKHMSDSLRRPVVVENMPGPFGIRAAQAVLQATSDGRTILLGGGVNAVTPLLTKSPPYDQADFKWVSTIALFNFLFFVDQNSPLKTVSDVIAAAKVNPRGFNIGTIGAGSIAHLSSLLFTSMAQVSVPTVAFRSTGEVMAALKGGQVQVAIDSLPGIIGQLQSGSLRALAVASPVVCIEN